MLKETGKKEKLRLKRKRRIMSLVLMLALVFSGITPVNVRAKSETLEKGEVSHEVRKYYDDDDDYYDSDYNKEDTSSYTPIYTIADLVGINSNPSGNYILMNDIDMTEETRKGGSWDTGNGWTPLYEFSGTLDGNGYRIIGMNIYGKIDSKYAGLFSSVRGCIKNLGMTDVNIDSIELTDRWDGYRDYNGIGAIAGYLKGKIQSCYVTGNVFGTNTEYKGIGVGGLVGYKSNDGKIYDSYNVAKVSGNGIAGIASGAYDIRCCYNIGNIESYYPIAVSNYDYNSDGDDCEEYDDDEYYYQFYDYYGHANYALQGKSLESEYTKMLTEAQMRTQNMYAGFDFENTWEIDPSSTYPYPQLKSNRHQRIDGFDIVTPPTKSVYSQGEKIDLSGGTANIIYEGGYSTTVILTDDMLNEYDTMKLGEQDIFIEYGGKKTSFPITVTDISVTSVKITGEGNNLTKGNSMQLKAVLEPQNVTDSMVKWSSSDTKIATVDEKGKVDALQPGKVEITATTANGVTAQYTINVTVPCVLLKLNQTEVTLYKGDTFALVPTLSPLDTTDTVSYKISNPNIATIDNSGKITGVAAGQVKITASAGTVTTTCDVTVKRKMEDFHIEGVVDKEYTGNPLEQKIKVTDGSTVLKEGTEYEVSYTDNIEIGTAKVRVRGKGYYEGSIEKDFKISKKGTGSTPSKTPSVPSAAPATTQTPLPSVTDGKNFTIYKGETMMLEKSVNSSGTIDYISWSSSDNSIVTVDDDGKITGCMAGKAEITGVTDDGEENTYNIIVKQNIEDFYITGVTDKEYTGDNVEQVFEVTDGSVVLDKGTDYTASYTNNIDSGTATLYITGTGYYEGTIEKDFNIIKKENPVKKTLEKTKISKLKNTSGKKMKVTFKAVKGAEGYEVRYSVKSSMKGSTSRKTTKTSYTISSLKKNKKYYVQVRAYCYDDSGKKVCSQWSGKKNIKIKK